jgi:hypothetical protein
MWTVVGKRLRIIGSGGASVTPEQLDHLIELVAKGELRGPVVDRELPLAQAAEAHRLIEERQTFGKVVLKPQRLATEPEITVPETRMAPFPSKGERAGGRFLRLRLSQNPSSRRGSPGLLKARQLSRKLESRPRSEGHPRPRKEAARV